MRRNKYVKIFIPNSMELKVFSNKIEHLYI